jgi:hypothetical protein
MTRKRKPIRGLQPQPSPKRSVKGPDVPALRSPSQARTRLAKWSLISLIRSLQERRRDGQAERLRRAQKRLAEVEARLAGPGA